MVVELTIRVSVLFNEPKLLKLKRYYVGVWHFSVSVLFNEPKLLKWHDAVHQPVYAPVSVLFNEPKLLKFRTSGCGGGTGDPCFSALQRAEIAEIQ